MSSPSTVAVLAFSFLPLLAQGERPVEVAGLAAGDGQAGDRFGHSVAVAGDGVMVGAPMDPALGLPGAVYAFREGPDGWAQQQKLHAGDAWPRDGFGTTLAMDGERLVVGAPVTSAAGVLPGAAYVFEHGGGAWTEVARLEAEGGSPLDAFGRGLALDGDQLAIGAPHDATLALHGAGAVYMFREVDGTWVQEQKVFPPDIEAGDEFGHAVALRGSLLLVGAPGDDDQGGLSGSVYLFERRRGVWVFAGKRYSAVHDHLDRFGSSLAISGAFAAVGSPTESPAGSASVLAEELGWQEDFQLQPPSLISGARFGTALAMGGATLAIGALQQDNVAHNAGSVYVYRHSAGVWGSAGQIQASDAAEQRIFGAAVAVQGERIVVGAPAINVVEGAPGSAYVFHSGLPLAGTGLCWGDGSGAACPCGNTGPAASGCAHSGGRGGALRALGSASSYLDEVLLEAAGLPPARPAAAFAGAGFAAGGQGLALFDGLRCLDAPLVRLGVLASDAAGEVRFGPGLYAQLGLQPGDLLRAQVLYRDPGGPCGTGSNFTGAVEVAVTL